MKKVMIYSPNSTSDRLRKRLPNLGFEVVETPVDLLSSECRGVQSKLRGKVDVIIYRICSCCSNQLRDLQAFFDGSVPEQLPVVVIRGGDYPGQGYLLFGSLWEGVEDAELCSVINNAITMAEEMSVARG